MWWMTGRAISGRPNQGGMTRREMSSDSALRALNISITTSTVSDSVLAFM